VEGVNWADYGPLCAVKTGLGQWSCRTPDACPFRVQEGCEAIDIWSVDNGGDDRQS
jgi:hypothetical protein